MALYEAKVRGRGSDVRTLSIQASSQSEASRFFEKQGRVLTVRKKASFDLSKKLTPADRQVFFTRMSAMLSSRVGTSDALRLMRDTFSGRIQAIAARLLSFVESGDDLPAAFERVGAPDFPDATVALIKAGARSGETGKAIKDAAHFEYELHTIRQGASKGMIVGVLSVLFAGVLNIASTLYVGPEVMNSSLIKAMNKDGSVNIDFINYIGIGAGWVTAILLLVGLVMWLLSTLGRRVAPVGADRIILRIPYYKDLVLAKNNFIVLYGLALLIKSGVRVEDALRLSAEGAPRGALRNDLANACQAVRTGRSWPKEMATMHPTDKAALMSATDREQIANTLDILASQYRLLYAQRLASFVPALNMTAALLMSIAGGVLFGTTILPMLMASMSALG